MAGQTLRQSALSSSPCGNLPHDYADLVYNRMAMQYWQSRLKTSYYDPNSRNRHHRDPHQNPLPRLRAKAFTDRNAPLCRHRRRHRPHEIRPRRQRLRHRPSRPRPTPRQRSRRSHLARRLRPGPPRAPANALQAREEFNATPSTPKALAQRNTTSSAAQTPTPSSETSPRAQADLEIAVVPPAAGRLRSPLNVAPASHHPTPSQALRRRPSNPTPPSPNSSTPPSPSTTSPTPPASITTSPIKTRIRLLAELLAMHNDSIYAEIPSPATSSRTSPSPPSWNRPRSDPLQLRPQSPPLNTPTNSSAAPSNTPMSPVASTSQNPNAFATKARILFFIKAAGAELLADQALALDPDNLPALSLKIAHPLEPRRRLPRPSRRSSAPAIPTPTMKPARRRSLPRYHPPPAHRRTTRPGRRTRSPGRRTPPPAALQLDTPPPRSRRKTIPALLQKSHLSAAAQLALAKDPDRPETLQLLTTLYEKQNQPAPRPPLLRTHHPTRNKPPPLPNSNPPGPPSPTPNTKPPPNSSTKPPNSTLYRRPHPRLPAASSTPTAINPTPPPPAATSSAALALEEARAPRVRHDPPPISNKPPNPRNSLTPDSRRPHPHPPPPSRQHRTRGGRPPTTPTSPSLNSPPTPPSNPASPRIRPHRTLLPTAMLPDPTQDPHHHPLSPHPRLPPRQLPPRPRPPATPRRQPPRPGPNPSSPPPALYRAPNWPATAPNRESSHPPPTPTPASALAEPRLRHPRHPPKPSTSSNPTAGPATSPPDLDARRKTTRRPGPRHPLQPILAKPSSKQMSQSPSKPPHPNPSSRKSPSSKSNKRRHRH